MHDVPARLLPSTIPGVLIASVVIVTLLGLLIKPIQRAFILNPYRVRENGEVYRLFTAGWLHQDLMHLVFNMVSLYFFADEALRALGVTRFLALYISAVIVAFIPTTLRYMRKPNYYSLGASGAVTAVMFSAILLHPKLKVAFMLVPYPIDGIWFAIGYLAYSVWHSYSSADNVNHDAHLSGAFYGALFTYAFEPEAVVRALKSLW